MESKYAIIDDDETSLWGKEKGENDKKQRLYIIFHNGKSSFFDLDIDSQYEIPDPPSDGILLQKLGMKKYEIINNIPIKIGDPFGKATKMLGDKYEVENVEKTSYGYVYACRFAFWKGDEVAAYFTCKVLDQDNQELSQENKPRSDARICGINVHTFD